MKIFRKTEFDTDDFMIGDQIDCGFGLATCQKVTEEGALFFTDDYDNEARSAQICWNISTVRKRACRIP